MHNHIVSGSLVDFRETLLLQQKDRDTPTDNAEIKDLKQTKCATLLHFLKKKKISKNSKDIRL